MTSFVIRGTLVVLDIGDMVFILEAVIILEVVTLLEDDKASLPASVRVNVGESSGSIVIP